MGRINGGAPTAIANEIGEQEPAVTVARAGSLQQAAGASVLDLPDDRAFDVTISTEPDRRVMALRGEIDRCAEPHLLASVAALLSDPRPLVVDCAGITFIDAGGLRVLLGALDRGPEDRLASAPSMVATLLRIIDRADLLEPDEAPPDQGGHEPSSSDA